MNNVADALTLDDLSPLPASTQTRWSPPLEVFSAATDHQGGRAYRVRTAWRGAEDVGVEIMPLGAADAPVPLTLARRLKILEAENAALKRQLSGE